MGLLGLLQGHAKPLIERRFLALAGIVTTFYPYLEATPSSAAQTGRRKLLPIVKNFLEPRRWQITSHPCACSAFGKKRATTAAVAQGATPGGTLAVGSSCPRKERGNARSDTES